MAGANASNMAPDTLCRLRETIENIQHFQFDRERPPAGFGGSRCRFDAGRRPQLRRAPRNGAASARAISARPAASPWRWPVLPPKAAARRSGSRPISPVSKAARSMARGSICSACRRSDCWCCGRSAPSTRCLRWRRHSNAARSQASSPNCRMTAPTSPRRAGSRSPPATHRGLGLLLRHRSSSMPSAAMTRWNVAAASGPRDAFGGIGITSFLLSLVKNRRGPCGRWNVAWDHHEYVRLPDFRRPGGSSRCGYGVCRRTGIARQWADSAPELTGKPFAVAATVKSARQIAALNDEAAGSACAPACRSPMRARCIPRLRSSMPMRPPTQRLLDAIADWCDRYTPLVGLDPPDGLFLDITGCAHLFGGEDACCRDLMQRLRSAGFPCARRGRRHARLRLGGGALRHDVASCTPRRRRAMPCVYSRSQLCGIDPDIAAPLAQAGLENHRPSVIDLPRAPLAARFGAKPSCAASIRRSADRRRADHAASAGAGLSRRAAFRRADRPRGRRARHHRASCARTGARDGTARQGRAPSADRAVPHRRQGGAHRYRHLGAVARAGTHPPAFHRYGLRCSATRPIPASAST